MVSQLVNIRRINSLPPLNSYDERLLPDGVLLRKPDTAFFAARAPHESARGAEGGGASLKELATFFGAAMPNLSWLEELRRRAWRGEAASGWFWRVAADGEAGWARARLSRVAVSEAEEAGLRAERASLEIAEQASAGEAALILGSQGWAFFDEAGRLLWANPAFLALLGLDCGEIRGATFASLCAEGSEAAAGKACDALGRGDPFRQTLCLRSGFGLGSLRVAATGRMARMGLDGARVYAVEASFAAGEARGVRSAAMDEGERLYKRILKANEELKQALAAAKKAVRKANQACEAKSTFLANMSHEIRTPMNAVIGFCDLLSSTHLDADQAECVEAISSSGSLLLQLINQILDHSRIESGHIELDESAVDVEALLRETRSIVANKARSKGLEVSIDVERLAEPCVLGDEVRIKQILINLAINAVKFTKEGRIRLIAVCQATSDDTMAELRLMVQDTGVGMKPQTIEKLFQPFARGGDQEGKGIEGTGLGLAICRRLANAMGGDIACRSEPGRGSEFELRLFLPKPRKDAAIALRSGALLLPLAMKFSDGGSDRLRVLVVDDNPNNLLITTKLAEHLGYEVDTVSNGVQALDALSENDYAIVLLDIRMAPIDGFETTKRIREGKAGEGNQNIYIIALTAHALEGHREKCLAAGMNDYLAKPLNLDQLNRSLGRARQEILA